jgi:hypothetical protein
MLVGNNGSLFATDLETVSAFYPDGSSWSWNTPLGHSLSMVATTSCDDQTTTCDPGTYLGGPGTDLGGFVIRDLDQNNQLAGSVRINASGQASYDTWPTQGALLGVDLSLASYVGSGNWFVTNTATGLGLLVAGQSVYPAVSV